MSTTSVLGLSLPSGPLAAPAAFIAWNWTYAYVVLASRHWKQKYGIDHQVSPRQDLRKYGEEAVKAGKLTQDQLEQIYRVEGASANSTEGFIFFTASVLFGLVAGVPRNTMMNACWTYTIGRIVYGAMYILIADNKLALTRALAWWTCCGACFALLWSGAKQGV